MSPLIPFENLKTLGIYFVGLLACLALGWAFGRVRPRRDRVDSFLLLILPAALYLVGTLTYFNLQHQPFMLNTSGRLAPPLAMVHGEKVYKPADSGIIFNTIYPPISYLAYAPAALFRSPTAAITAGSSIALMLGLAPILGLCLARHGDTGKAPSPLFSAFVFLAFWRFVFISLLGITFAIHADAPAFSIGAMACVVLYAGRLAPSLSTKTLAGSAILAAMAIWTKQTSATLLVVLPIWVFLAHGRAAGLRYCGWGAVALATLTATFVLIFGGRNLAFNLMEIPKSHPWVFAPDYWKGFLAIGVEASTFVLPTFLMLGMLLLAIHWWERSNAPIEADDRGRFDRLGATLRRNYWALFVAVGLSMIPMSFLTRIKVGGAFNAYVHVLYYLVAAICVVLLDWHARNLERGAYRVNAAIKIALLLSPVSPLLIVDSRLIDRVAYTTKFAENPEEYAYRYALKHPGEVYYPWNPLATFLAEGRSYHFEGGTVDRELGGFLVSESHFRRYTPERLRLVAYSPSALYSSHWSMKYLQNFKRQVVIDELPGWVCYER